MHLLIFLQQHFVLRVYLILSIGFIFYCKDTNKSEPTEPEPNKLPFVIENLGVTFADWDKQSNHAGDFYLTYDFSKIFSEFGAQVLDPDWNIKELPTFTYVISNDASVFSISEGQVVRIYHQEESNDYDFSIRSMNDPSYDIVYDHLVNLKIKIGDYIQAGDTLGSPKPLNSEIGLVEIMINNLNTGLSYCPFCCFNEDKLEEYEQKVFQLMKDWEEFKGDTAVYDEKNHVFPGCRYESMITY